LSLGDEINIRTERYRGTSSLSGEFVVEDVDVGGDLFRRLIFFSNKNLVQSEARMVRGMCNLNACSRIVDAIFMYYMSSECLHCWFHDMKGTVKVSMYIVHVKPITSCRE